MSAQLNELAPGPHEKRSALFNSGAEALENAVKVARHHTKKRRLWCSTTPFTAAPISRWA